MTIRTFPVHISAGGEVSPIPDWPGGEAEAEIIVHLLTNDERLTIEERQNRARAASVARWKAESDEEAMERRKAAARRLLDRWDGFLEGARDMTAKEIRAERLERKYGQ